MGTRTKKEFSEALELGKEAEHKTISIFNEQNISCEYNVSEDKWDNCNENENKELQKKDKMYGDLIISYQKFKCDVKRNAISLESLRYFRGDYYILWNGSLKKCILINTKDTKNLNYNNCIKLSSSGDPGFSFEQLQRLPHISLEEFIKICHGKQK